MPVTDTEDALRKSSMLRGAPPSAMAKLAAIARVKSYTRGATLFLQGERANAIGLVASGWVKLFRITPSGNEAVVRVFSHGESFGEAVALRHAPYPVAAMAVSDCSIIWLDSTRLLGLLREDPEIAVSILSSTFIHLHDLVNQVEQLKSQNGAQRVAGFLADLSGQMDGRADVTLPYDKVLIAAQLGIKPESLSRSFARLRPLGVTIDQSRAVIDDVAMLRAYAAEDPGTVWSKRD